MSPPYSDSSDHVSLLPFMTHLCAYIHLFALHAIRNPTCTCWCSGCFWKDEQKSPYKHFVVLETWWCQLGCLCLNPDPLSNACFTFLSCRNLFWVSRALLMALSASLSEFILWYLVFIYFSFSNQTHWAPVVPGTVMCMSSHSSAFL